MRTPKNILRHEFIGLECEVVRAGNASQVGIKGTVIDETMKTVVIRADGAKRVPKQGTVFRFTLGGTKIDVEGDFIIARPEDRIKKQIRKW
ncbi:MAG: ribonuclease P protein component 1 [Candidatus Aenigmarchaeota archaeon]|nr:ribonuclease P protein component 1 [Candidatus Aenigmarchaeota archaeon]